MKPNPLHRLPAPLEAATQRLKLAARDAAERCIESLGLAALASTNAYHRDGLLGAQFELNRKSAVFVLTFNDEFDQRVVRELGPRLTQAAALENPDPWAARAAATTAAATAPGPNITQPPTAGAAENWASLSLVENKEVEAQISAERFGLEMAHSCEWELRELEGYVAALLGDAGGERDRNPLRPDLVGHAMIRGVEAVSERAEVRKVLAAEFSRALGGLLRGTYADIVIELRAAGVQPLGLSVRNRVTRSADTAAGRDNPNSEHGAAAQQPAQGGSAFGQHSRHDVRGALTQRGGPGGFVPSTHAGMPGARMGTPLGQVDPALMSLIRRLAHAETGDAGVASSAGFGAPSGAGFGDGHGSHGGPFQASQDGALPANLIHAHREELRQASRGTVDHMVIDVIGFLFDQILADPKVPPQMARQIARLQLPVLRAALGDPSFFSSRRHPVRRFINRMASLGAAFENFSEEGAQNLLAKVRALIQEIVEGDFEQIELYEQKLAALEAFTNELARNDTSEQADAAALLSEKEDQQRLRALYAQRLAGDLKDLATPAFMRDFLSNVWSQVLLRASEKDGTDSALVQRLRGVGRELFLSVQPKATPALRKNFLAELPKLMQDLSDGMNTIAWPETQRRAFFGQLMPAHAEALKSAGGRQLDINLMARQVEGALQRPPPKRTELPPASVALPVLSEEVSAPLFSADEAQRVGLVQEAAVDWGRAVPVDVDIDLTSAAAMAGAGGAGGAVGASPTNGAHDPGPSLPGLPDNSPDASEPSEGRALADHLQIGFAYKMLLDGEWQKVRLSHISPSRSFFIFSHGARHLKTVSLTQRMLLRLCETGRLKAFEAEYLIERATARARRQLAALSAGAGSGPESRAGARG
jgi:Protein of unknown function (DUF1631)